MSGVYPYRTEAIAALHPDGWWSIPPTDVAVAALEPTQPAVVIDRLVDLIAGGVPETGDPHPHVVIHDGRCYVHDGHHRYVIALVQGAKSLTCRVVDEDGRWSR